MFSEATCFLGAYPANLNQHQDFAWGNAKRRSKQGIASTADTSRGELQEVFAGEEIKQDPGPEPEIHVDAIHRNFYAIQI